MASTFTYSGSCPSFAPSAACLVSMEMMTIIELWALSRCELMVCPEGSSPGQVVFSSTSQVFDTRRPSVSLSCLKNNFQVSLFLFSEFVFSGVVEMFDCAAAFSSAARNGRRYPAPQRAIRKSWQLMRLMITYDGLI